MLYDDFRSLSAVQGYSSIHVNTFFANDIGDILSFRVIISDRVNSQKLHGHR